MEATPQRKGSVAQGVDAGMHAVQPASGEPSCDRGVAQPAIPELPATDNPMLALRDAPDGVCVKSCPTVGHGLTQKRHDDDRRR